MKKITYLFLIVYALFFTISCDNKDDVPNFDSDGYVEAYFSGTQWYASAYGLWIVLTDDSTTAHHLSIVGIRETVVASEETLDLSIAENSTISVGIFNLAKEDSEGKSNSRFFDSQGAFDYEFTSGNLTIESLSSERATGTFSGTLRNASGDTLTVSRGVFDVPIDYQEAVN